LLTLNFVRRASSWLRPTIDLEPADLLGRYYQDAESMDDGPSTMAAARGPQKCTNLAGAG
jgi:hypothetical protein